MRAAGFVLVGGESRRMGRDKALLPLASELLVENVARKVQAVAESASLVGAAERYSHLGFECLNDLRRGGGPLAGIETALSANRAEYNLIVACDMPGLSEAWLSQLLAEAQRRNSVCLVSTDLAGRLHPLCGVWHRRSLPYVQRALDTRQFRVLDLVRELRAEQLASPQPLANVNTPEEWRAWQLTS